MLPLPKNSINQVVLREDKEIRSPGGYKGSTKRFDSRDLVDERSFPQTFSLGYAVLHNQRTSALITTSEAKRSRNLNPFVRETAAPLPGHLSLPVFVLLVLGSSWGTWKPRQEAAGTRHQTLRAIGQHGPGCQLGTEPLMDSCSEDEICLPVPLVPYKQH